MTGSTVKNKNIQVSDVYILGDTQVQPVGVEVGTDTVFANGGYTIKANVLAPAHEPGVSPFAVPDVTWTFKDAANADIATLTPNATDPSKVLVAAKTKVGGTVSVVATTANNLSDTITLTLPNRNATSLKIGEEFNVVGLEDTIDVTATILPAEAYQVVSWKVLDAGATVQLRDSAKTTSAMIIGGNADVPALRVVAIADSSPAITDTLTIRVGLVKVDSFKVSGTHKLYGTGSTATLKSTVYPDIASNPKLSWSSSNPEVVSVDAKGKITAMAGTGSAVITVRTIDGSDKSLTHAVEISTIYIDSMDTPNARAGKTITGSGSGYKSGIQAQNSGEPYPTDSVWFYGVSTEPWSNNNSLSGIRRSMMELDASVVFQKKLIVEFDWRIGTPRGSNDSEGLMVFRSGTTTDNDLDRMSSTEHDYFMMSTYGSKTSLLIGVGKLTPDILVKDSADRKKDSIKWQTYRLRYNTLEGHIYGTDHQVELTGLTLAGSWYHTKLEFYKATADGQDNRVGVTIVKDTTGTGDSIQDVRHVMIPAPAGWDPQGLQNIFTQMGRYGGSNFGWASMIDNMTIKIADDENIPPTGIKITPQFEVIGSTGWLQADIEPFNATNVRTTWEVIEGASEARLVYDSVQITNSRKPTLEYIGGKVQAATVKVKATTWNGISDTLTMLVGPVAVDSIGIAPSTAGDSIISFGGGFTTLKADPYPKYASNLGITWSSLDPDIATVDAATGVVTALPRAEGDTRDTVYARIKATAADGKGCEATFKVKVIFAKITRIDMYGAERYFYGADRLNDTVKITPAFSPSADDINASQTTVTWASTNESVLTVDQTGKVTIKGYGKAAATATATDGSGTVGYYYVEVAEHNPYALFSNLEVEAESPFATPTNSEYIVSSTTTTWQDFQGTKAYYSKLSSTGARGYLLHLKEAAQGDYVKIRFDWYLSSTTDGIMSIRPDSIGDMNAAGKPMLGYGIDTTPDATKNGVIFHAEKNILALRWNRRVGTRALFYFTGPYDKAASDDPGTAATKWPKGDSLAFAPDINSWYTIDLDIDFTRGRITTFTITDRDNPTNTATVSNIPLDSALMADATKRGKVKSLFTFGQRYSGASGTSGGSMNSAVDNWFQTTSNVQAISVTFDPNGGMFADSSTTSKQLTSVAGEAIDDIIPTLLDRTGYTFKGWNDASGPHVAGTTYDANVTLTAQWEKITYTVTFMGTGIETFTQTVDYGEKVVQPTKPTREECESDAFQAWMKPAPDATKAWNFAVDVVKADITLTAKWNEEKCEDIPNAVVTEALPGVKLYPNPVSDVLSISGLEAGDVLSILDFTGRLLHSVKVSAAGTERIAVSTLQQGDYLVKVARGKTVKVVKIIVAK